MLLLNAHRGLFAPDGPSAPAPSSDQPAAGVEDPHQAHIRDITDARKRGSSLPLSLCRVFDSGSPGAISTPINASLTPIDAI